MPATLPTAPEATPTAVAAPVTPEPTPTPKATETPKPTPTPNEEPPVPEPTDGRSLSEALRDHLSGKEPAKEKTPEKKEESVTPATPLPDDLSDKDFADAVAKETKNLDPKQAKAWSELRTSERAHKRKVKELETQTARVADLEKQLAEKDAAIKAAASNASSAELDALRKARETDQQELAAVRLEKTELYQKEIGAPLAQAEQAITSLATNYELQASDLINAVNMPAGKERSKRLSELAADMSDYDKTQFYRVADSLQQLGAKREALMKDAKANYDRFVSEQSRQSEEAKQKFQKEWADTLPKTWDALAERVPFLKPEEGNKAWNETLDKTREFASQVSFSDLDISGQAEVMHRASAFPLLEKITGAQAARIKSLEDTIARLRGAAPDDLGDGNDPKKETDDIPKEAGLSDAFRVFAKKNVWK